MLAQAMAEKELSRACALHSAGETDSARECVRKAQDQLIGISRDLTYDDLRRYADCRSSQDSPSASFGHLKQPVAFLQIILHRFANQQVVAAEEVVLILEFLQKMFVDSDELVGTDELEASLQLIIQHNGLYRNAYYSSSNMLDRSGTGPQSLPGSRFGQAGLKIRSGVTT